MAKRRSALSWRDIPLLRHGILALLALIVAALGAGVGIWLGDDHETPSAAPVATAATSLPDATVESAPPPSTGSGTVVVAANEPPDSATDEPASPVVAVSEPIAVASLEPPPAENVVSTPSAATYDDARPESGLPAIPQQRMTAAPPGPPPWQRFAQRLPASAFDGRPLIAVVIDDLGPPRGRTERTIALPGPLTLAFLPYAEDLERLTAEARANGHELLAHVPMEPLGAGYDTGPNALVTGLRENELRALLDWNLSQFEGYVGFNNHMGSRLSLDAASMAILLAEVRDRGLLFLDSRTTGGSFGWKIAAELGIPYAKRDVFLDNVIEVGAINRQLAALERVARKQGYAVAIGHPHAATLDALAAWLPGLADRGFVLAPISAIVARRQGVDLAAKDTPSAVASETSRADYGAQ
ncbi:MAG: divergent polysaccharide deacetylase family protein [Alphaproteobacteria bacterium]